MKRSKNSAERIWESIFLATDILRHQCVVMDPKLLKRITLAKIRVMSVVMPSKGKGVMMKDIASILRITPSAVSQIIDSLVKDDVVVRVQSGKDRRLVQVKLTEYGESIRKLHGAAYTQLMYDAMKDIPEEDLDVFMDVISKLTQKINPNN